MAYRNDSGLLFFFFIEVHSIMSWLSRKIKKTYTVKDSKI